MKSLNELIDDGADQQQPAPPAKPRVTAIIVLSMLLGVLLTLIVVGAFVHLQTSRALEAQVLAVEDELKAKSLALDDLKLQIAMLSKHIQVLKEYAVARSLGSNESARKSVAPAPASAPVSTPVSASASLPDPAGRVVGPGDVPRQKPAKK